MIIGAGIDIAETKRIEQSLEKYGDRFRNRVYTPDEIAYCERFRNKVERYAARFAAKEALLKALGTGWGAGIRWRDVEITHLPSGKPELALRGRAEEIARKLGISRAAVSLSHANAYAVAQVVLESDG